MHYSKADVIYNDMKYFFKDQPYKHSAHKLASYLLY